MVLYKISSAPAEIYPIKCCTWGFALRRERYEDMVFDTLENDSALARMTVPLNEMKLPQIFSEAEYIVSVSPSNPIFPIGIGWNIAEQELGILTICVLLIRVTRPKVSHVPDSYSGIFVAWSLKPLGCKFLIKQMATMDRYWIWHLIERKQRNGLLFHMSFLQMRLQHVQTLTDIYEFYFQLVFVSCTRTNIIENAPCQDPCFRIDAIVGLIEPV